MVDYSQYAVVTGGPLHNSQSIFECLENGLLKDPNNPAVICTDQAPGALSHLLGEKDTALVSQDIDTESSIPGYLIITYKQVFTMAQRLVAGWMARGLRPESTILICIPNCAEFCVIVWACVLMRLTMACMDPSVLTAASHQDFKDTLRSLRPSIIVVRDRIGSVSVDIATRVLRMMPPLGILLEEDPLASGWWPLSTFADTIPSMEDTRLLLDKARDDNPQRIHSILFTSGTSGKPKGCPLRVAGQTHFLQSWNWLLNEKNSHRALQQAHNSRAIAFTQMLQTWSTGGTVLMPSRTFNIEDTITAIDTFGATFVVLSPAMVHEIAGQIRSQKNIDLSSVRTVQIGGDAVSKTEILECAALFPRAQVCTVHGMSEGVAAFKWPFFDISTSRIPFLGEICPIGMVAPGSAVRLWNADKQCMALKDEPGEMHISSSSIIRHYLNGVSEASFYDDVEGRWFITGDVAIMDSTGMIYILGRSKDVIKRNGISITPGQLESSLQRFLKTQTCVVGILDKFERQSLYAVVKSMNGNTEESINQHIEHSLGSQFVLDKILTLSDIDIDEFPVNQTFKIDRHRLQQMIIQNQGHFMT